MLHEEAAGLGVLQGRIRNLRRPCGAHADVYRAVLHPKTTAFRPRLENPRGTRNPIRPEGALVRMACRGPARGFTPIGGQFFIPIDTN